MKFSYSFKNSALIALFCLFRNTGKQKNVSIRIRGTEANIILK
jgi:hypothetical protein